MPPINLRLSCLLIALTMCCHQKFVSSDRALEQFDRIHGELDGLNDNFTRRAKLLTIHLQRVCQSGKNHPLLAILAEVAAYEAVWFEAARKGLMSAEAAVIRYFVTESMPLDEILTKNDNLVDLVVWQAYERSMNDAETSEKLDRIRARIFLYARRYHGIPGVMELARGYYAKSLAKAQARKTLIAEGLDNALNKYRDEVYLMWIEEYETAALATINALIEEATGILDDAIEGQRPGSVKILLATIRWTKERISGKIRQFNDSQVDAVDKGDMLAFEQRVLSGTVGIESYLEEVEANLEWMRDDLASTMQDLFLRPQVLARRLDSYPMMVLSAQMAQIEGLMHGDEWRMLGTLMELLQREQQALERIYAVNRYAVELVVLRLVELSLESALGRVIKRRKNMYLSLSRFDSLYGIEELARKYAQRLQARTNHLNEVRALLALLTAQPSIKQLDQETTDRMNELVHAGNEMWSSEMWARASEPALLKASLGKELFEAIAKADAESNKKKILRFRQSAATINAVDMADVRKYEKGLLARRAAA